MAYSFPSPEWLQALKDKLNNDEKYAQTAQKWEGEIVFFIEPGGPIQETMIFYTDLWHGECRDAFIVADEAQIRQESCQGIFQVVDEKRDLLTVQSHQSLPFSRSSRKLETGPRPGASPLLRGRSPGA